MFIRNPYEIRRSRSAKSTSPSHLDLAILPGALVPGRSAISSSRTSPPIAAEERQNNFAAHVCSFLSVAAYTAFIWVVRGFSIHGVPALGRPRPRARSSGGNLKFEGREQMQMQKRNPKAFDSGARPRRIGWQKVAWHLLAIAPGRSANSSWNFRVSRSPKKCESSPPEPPGSHANPADREHRQVLRSSAPENRNWKIEGGRLSRFQRGSLSPPLAFSPRWRKGEPSMDGRTARPRYNCAKTKTPRTMPRHSPHQRAPGGARRAQSAPPERKRA